MPRVVLEFNLPEERQELEYAQRGADYWNVLYEFDQWLRKSTKHGEDIFEGMVPPEKAQGLATYLRAKLREFADGLEL